MLTDRSCVFDPPIEWEKEEKCTNYSELKYEIVRIWKMRKVKVIPVVIGALGAATKHFGK